MSISKVFLSKDRVINLYKTGGVALVLKQLNKDCVTAEDDINCLIDLPRKSEKNIEVLETRIKDLIKYSSI